MKKLISWGSYFLLCAAVIVAAVQAGSRHGHCHECEIAIGKKDGGKEVVYWEKVILQGENR